MNVYTITIVKLFAYTAQETQGIYLYTGTAPLSRTNLNLNLQIYLLNSHYTHRKGTMDPFLKPASFLWKIKQEERIFSGVILISPCFDEADQLVHFCLRFNLRMIGSLISQGESGRCEELRMPLDSFLLWLFDQVIR